MDHYKGGMTKRTRLLLNELFRPHVQQLKQMLQSQKQKHKRIFVMDVPQSWPQ